MIELLHHLSNCHGEWTLLSTFLANHVPFLHVWLASRGVIPTPHVHPCVCTHGGE
jgi:hypothetical protein